MTAYEPAIWSRKMLYGWESVKTTVCGSGASMWSIGLMVYDVGELGVDNQRSNVHLTSADVMALPEWNFTPERRWKVYTFPSGLTSQLVASSGLNEPS